MKAENQVPSPPPSIRLAAIFYFMGSSMLVQFTTKVCIHQEAIAYQKSQ
jgi:hypothetical protein